MNHIYWDVNHISMLTDDLGASAHSHGMIQFFLALDNRPDIKVGRKKLERPVCLFVQKNVKHSVRFHDGIIFTSVIEPASDMGAFLDVLMKDKDYYLLDDEVSEKLIEYARPMIDVFDRESYIRFLDQMYQCLGFQPVERQLDGRIIEFLNNLEDCTCLDHSVERFAEELSVSTSRLSHLFSEQVGISLKSYLTLHQLERAYQDILEGSSITEAAMNAGFDSPSHFAATVKRLMGLPTRRTLKDSRFLKVY